MAHVDLEESRDCLTILRAIFRGLDCLLEGSFRTEKEQMVSREGAAYSIDPTEKPDGTDHFTDGGSPESPA